MNTVDILESFTKDELTEFTPGFEEMLIGAIFDWDNLVKVEYLKPEYFDKKEHYTIVKAIIESKKSRPDRQLIIEILQEALTMEDPFEEIFKIVAKKSNAGNYDYIKEKWNKWIEKKSLDIIQDSLLDAISKGNIVDCVELISQAQKTSHAGITENEDLFNFCGVNDLLTSEIRMEYLIKDLLVMNESCLIGGKDKCLKTGMTCDLAASLATGTPFLGKWEVPVKRRVAFFSAESGRFQIQQRLAKIMQAKGVKCDNEYLMISFEKPRLSDALDLIKVGKIIEKYKAEVVIIDPLYLTLLAGDDSGTSPSDLYAMGNKLSTLNDVISKGGATPILVHHYKKSTQEGEVGLEHFTFTGAGSFARQSLHIARRKRYSGTATNEMKIMVHGFSLGGEFKVDINEDNWEVRIHEEDEDSTLNENLRDANKLAVLLMDEIRDNGPSSKNKLRKSLGWNEDKFALAVTTADDMVREVIIKGVRHFELTPANELLRVS